MNVPVASRINPRRVRAFVSVAITFLSTKLSLTKEIARTTLCLRDSVSVSRSSLPLSSSEIDSKSLILRMGSEWGHPLSRL